MTKKLEEPVDDCAESHCRIKMLESELDDHKHKHKQRVDENKDDKSRGEITKKDKIIESLKVIKMNLEKDLEITEQNWKDLTKSIKANEKETIQSLESSF